MSSSRDTDLFIQHDADYCQNCRETRNIMTSKQQQHLLLDSLNERGLRLVYQDLQYKHSQEVFCGIRTSFKFI